MRRIPQQLVLAPVIWLALAGLGRLRMPRWSLAVVTGVNVIGVKHGARVAVGFTIAKLLPLLLLIGAGIFVAIAPP